MIPNSPDFQEFLNHLTNNALTSLKHADAIARAKLRVEMRLKHLRALRPSIWGETSTVNVKSGDDVADMSTEELERKIQDLEEKNESVKEPRAA